MFSDEASTLKAVTTSERATKSQPLRNSCEPCHVSKLKCSREKPMCARCTKNGTNCTYAPVKRPGRPRKVRPSSSVTQSSVELGCSPAATPRRRGTLDSSVADDQIPGLGILDLVTPSSSSQDVSAADSIDASIDSVGLTSCADVFDFMHTHMPDDHELFVDPLAKRPSHEDPWMLLESPRMDPSPCLGPSLWPSDPAGFTADCASLVHWAAASPLLASLRDDRVQAAGDHCFCPTAAANLLFHRDSARTVQLSSALEACLHLQRILDWTWATLKHCHGCCDDELIHFVVASSAKEVVTMHRRIIDHMTRRLRNGGNAHVKSTDARRRSGRPLEPGSGYIHRQHSDTSVFQSTVLSFGDKVIHGSVKTVFLRRLINLRLQRLGSLLRELLSWTQTEASIASPLQILVSSILERINITTGMLSTLEFA